MALTDRELYSQQDWSAARSRARTFRSWYDGIPLKERRKRRDRTGDGSKIRKFPLGMNLTTLAVDIHRDFARGLVEDDDPLAVRVSVDRSKDADVRADMEEFINDQVWVPSGGATVQQEALLDMNIYGGCLLQLAWEPWNFDLPLRISIRLIKDPSSLYAPSWNPRTPLRLPEAYVGYEISPDAARTVYNVEPKSESEAPLYMEHWTPDHWEVRIDDQVPTIKYGEMSWRLSGENPWGFVPIYYVPHERTTELLGRGAIGDEDIVKEINARSRDVSDIMRSAWPGMLYGTDMDRKPVIAPVLDDGNTVLKILNLGRTRNIAGANPPKIGSIPIPDVPDSVVGWPKELMAFWQLLRRISPAVFGMDDTQSGRITGPAVSARMVSSTSHAVTERINFSATKTLMDKDMLRMLLVQQVALRTLNIPPPMFAAALQSHQIAGITMRQKWAPMLPLDKAEEHKQWIERIKENATSVDEMLRYYGVEDVEGEKALIEDWATKMAEIEAKAQPQQPFGGGNGGQG